MPDRKNAAEPDNFPIKLQLLRHAKSSWKNAEVEDITRPLSARGQRAALTMGRAIAREALLPDLVLCSPARRAQETWRLVSGELPLIPETRTIDSLYDFGDGSVLLEAIHQHHGGAVRLMLVGHNPSIEELAKRLIAHGPQKLRRRLEEKFPTGALAVIAFAAEDWSQVIDKTGTLLNFLRPADVADDA